jgi:hypothetical protein
MKWVAAHCVKTFESVDGKSKLFILRRDDELYQFVGMSEQEEDGESFWAPSDYSGLFDSVQTAEREAAGNVPWLKRMLTERDWLKSN